MMTLQPGHDPRILREQEYADDGHLDVRCRTHQLYTVDPVDFGRWTLERLAWQGDERVLDVGCGPGELLCGMARQHAGWGALVGLDFSPGMIATAARSAVGLPVCFLVGDAQGLPFPNASFDVVLARHMLYHVPHIDRAVAEAARVLCAGGRFLTVTNSADTMAEYTALRRAAAARFPSMAQPESSAGRFSLENAPAWLQPHFDRVETHVLPGTLRFSTARPFVDYVASGRAMMMQPGHSEAEWQTVLAYVQATVETIIADKGHFDVSKVAGAVVGIKRG
ncbi:MAG: class I SAM-dependent methyltransferase [Anaerolineae bacterium]